MRKLSLLFSLVLLAASGALAQFKLVKDFMAEKNYPSNGSIETVPFDSWVLYNDQMHFLATEPVSGTCIYKSDGTTEGNVIAVDIAKGSFRSVTKDLTVANDLLFFVGEDSLHPDKPFRLYVSDGTPAPVKRLGDIQVIDPVRGEMISFNNSLFFTARDNNHGYELWKSDGTAEGTVMVKDLIPGNQGTDIPLVFHATNNLLYFRAKSGDTYKLWKTDGTTAGTSVVTDFGSIDGVREIQGRSYFASVENTLYFVARKGTTGFDLWKTDGTTAGTMLVMNDQFDVETVGVWKNKIFYSRGVGLYITDGTPGNSTFLGGAFDGRVDVGVEFNGDYYFIANDELWRTDGTEAGTEKTNASDAVGVVALGANSNGILLISFGGTNQSAEVYIDLYDGETAKLFKLHHGTAYSYGVFNFPRGLRTLKTFNDKFIVAHDGDNQGTEPWITDGTAANTRKLKNIYSQPYLFYAPHNMRAVGSKVFMNGIGESELWASDGTEAGTVRIDQPRDIVNGDLSFYQQLADVNGVAVFTESRLIHDGTILGTRSAHLWRSDGTVAGTEILVNSAPTFGPVIDGYLYLFGSGYLSKTDGNELFGIAQVDYGQYGYVRSKGVLRTASKNSLLFINSSNILWISDGTEAGTKAVKDLGAFSIYEDIVPAKTQSFFIGPTGENGGDQLWRTDGTAAGTFVPKTIPVTNNYLFSEILCALGDVVIYSTKTPEQGVELWRSDGTNAGTYMLGDINEGPGDLNFKAAYNTESLFYFSVQQPGKSTMWQTDGTTSGTKMLYDLPQGFKSYKGKKFNERVLLPATTSGTGSEIWRTDFTKKGTKVVGEITPGPNSSFISEAVVTSSQYFFIATDESQYPKLWVLDNGFVFKKDQSIEFQTIGDRMVEDPAFELKATGSAGLPLAFEVVSGPATLDGSMITVTGAGTVVVKVVQEGNEEFYAASEEQTFTVTKYDQSILIQPMPAVSVSSPPFPLSATTNSQLPLTFEIISGPATVSGNVITLTGLGTVVVRVSQEGNAKYNPASAERSFLVMADIQEPDPDPDPVTGLADEDFLISISPNPATSTIVVTAPSSVFKSIYIADVFGRNVITTNISTESTQLPVDQLPRGIYIVKLKSSDNSIVARKVVLR